jgi:hypothetical protein
LLDSEIAEKINSPLPSVKKILTDSFDKETIPGLANLGKGKWKIIPLNEVKIEEPEKVTS